MPESDVSIGDVAVVLSPLLPVGVLLFATFSSRHRSRKLAVASAIVAALGMFALMAAVYLGCRLSGGPVDAGTVGVCDVSQAFGLGLFAPVLLLVATAAAAGVGARSTRLVAGTAAAATAGLLIFLLALPRGG